MKKHILIIISVFIITVIFSCTSNFEEANTNPNYPDVAPSTNIFAGVIRSLSAQYGSTEMNYPASYIGHVTKGTYTDAPRYNTPPSSSVWRSVYSSILLNADIVIEKAEEEGNKNLQAASMILKAYGMQLVTDIYGKVPYSEAGKGAEGIIHPKYDSEEFIYDNLLNQLEIANEMLADNSEAGSLGYGDILYNGDVLKWKKFCNSLHLRVAIRISNINEEKSKSEISKILNDPDKYPIFESNDDNALLKYPGGDWIEPWTADYSSIGDQYIAKPIVDKLLELNDPRLEYYADTAKYKGTLYNGLAVGNKGNIKYSRVDGRFVDNAAGNVYFLKYCEVEFIKAEAAQRSFIAADAKQAYETAIRSSCEEYNIDESNIDAYLQNSGVSYNNDLNQIYIQKWISLFRQSWEAWAEMRRTDIPTLPPANNSQYLDHNRTPFRFSYPDSERKLNKSNVPSSVNEVDNYWGYQIWWDTRNNVN